MLAGGIKIFQLPPKHNARPRHDFFRLGPVWQESYHERKHPPLAQAKQAHEFLVADTSQPIGMKWRSHEPSTPP
jgi:hypothetical protein